MTSQEVFLLPLNDDGSPQVAGQYIYVESQSDDAVVLRFVIEGASSICRHGSLWVNIPEEGSVFKRDHFREYKYKALQPIGVENLLTILPSTG